MTEETAATNAAGDSIAPETQVAESAPAAQAGKPKEDGFTKRIDELTKNWRETERDAAEAKRDAQYWREQALRSQPPPEQPKTEPVKAKTLEDFEYDQAKYDAYRDSLIEERAVKAAERKLKESQDAEVRSRRIAEFKKRISDFSQNASDFNEKVFSPTNPVSEAMREVFEESDEGPALAYYLANNPTLADQISRLPAMVASRELGRIEAKLISEREKAAKKVSDAPAPPPKIEGSGDPKIEKDPREMSDSEFDKWRRKQIAQRR